MSKNKKTLLPSGFHDVLPPDASAESEIISRMMKIFEQWGYTQVKPPMAEFEESLLSGKGERLDSQTFRITDKISNKIMGLRADMTTQIARIAAIRLKDRPRPLRLSYSGQVLRAEGEGLYAERQLAQTGLELIGSLSPAADAEVIIIAIDSLTKSSLEGISVDFSMPRLSKAIMEYAKTDLSTKKKLLELIEKKDAAAIKKTGDKSAPLLAQLIGIAGPAEKALDKLTKLSLPKEGKEYLKRLEKIIAAINKSGVKITITIDPLERRGFEYHTGIGFSFFAKNGSEELGRGGRYRIEFDKKEDAVGFTFSVNAIYRALPKTKDKKKIFVPYNTPSKESEDLREKGLVTVHGLEKNSAPAGEAKNLKCSFIYKKGEILPVR